MKNIVVLTGAGISAESGIPTFRGVDGLWEGHRIEDVASPEGFASNPDLVYDFYNLRRNSLFDVEPNAAHLALAELEAHPEVNLTVVTQNVDDLHERAGSIRVLHMHGELRKARCLKCNLVVKHKADLTAKNKCKECGGQMRPHIVWFGEMPFGMETIEDCLLHADLFVSIGTSGNVYPAAGFVQVAQEYAVDPLEINLDPSSNSVHFDKSLNGPAGTLVPEWVKEIVAE